MFTHSRKSRSRLFVPGALLVLSAPMFAQNPAPVANPPAQPAPVAAPAPAKSEMPSWLPLAAILGSVLGLSGLGLAGWVFSQKMRTEQQLKQLLEQQSQLNTEMTQLRARVPGADDVERFICVQLRSKYEAGNPGLSLSSALDNIAWKQAHSYASREIEPKLNSAGQMAAKTGADLEQFAAHVKQRQQETLQSLALAGKSDEELRSAFGELSARTKAELEAFVFNIYNLLFTQSEGDPVVPQLENRIQRYETMLSGLRAIQPDEVTRLTLREFEETLDKIAQKLRDARTSLANARSVAVEPLPYLEEKDRARAQTLLEEQRKKLRGQTAGAKESLDALRDAAIELAKPLQTLWMGASVPDPDRPERNQRCRALLLHIKTVLETAGIYVYEPQIGGPLDTARASHRFVGATHEAPFVVQKVTKLGLTVEDKTEPGAVVVA